MKTRDDAEAWVKSLQPGDKVIQIETGWGKDNSPIAVLTVKRVTDTGIVRTEEGQSFKQSKYSNSFNVVCYGGVLGGAIVPYDDAKAEKAVAHQQKVRADEERQKTLNKAKNICWDIAYGKKPLSISLAKTIVAAYQEK